MKYSQSTLGRKLLERAPQGKIELQIFDNLWKSAGKVTPHEEIPVNEWSAGVSGFMPRGHPTDTGKFEFNKSLSLILCLKIILEVSGCRESEFKIWMLLPYIWRWEVRLPSDLVELPEASEGMPCMSQTSALGSLYSSLHKTSQSSHSQDATEAI